MSTLPPFPLDDQTLAMLRSSAAPDFDVAERSSIGDTLDMLSRLGGSDTTAVESSEVRPGPFGEDVQWDLMRDACYSINDALVALIDEVTRLRVPASPSSLTARAPSGEHLGRRMTVENVDRIEFRDLHGRYCVIEVWPDSLVTLHPDESEDR